MKNYFTKILLVSFICIFASVACKAQYATGIGIRAGKVASGIDVKHFFNTEHQLAIEVNAGYTLEAHGGYFAKLFLIKQASIKKSNIPFPLKPEVSLAVVIMNGATSWQTALMASNLSCGLACKVMIVEVWLTQLIPE